MCNPRNLVLLTLSTVDGQWGVVNRVSPEVHHNLLCLPHIEGQVVSTTPFSQLYHILSVECFIVVADETYHWCVIGKLDDVVGLEPCGAPVLSVVVLEVLWPTRNERGLIVSDGLNGLPQDPCVSAICVVIIDFLTIWRSAFLMPQDRLALAVLRAALSPDLWSLAAHGPLLSSMASGLHVWWWS